MEMKLISSILLLHLLLFSKTCLSEPNRIPRLTPFHDSITRSYEPNAEPPPHLPPEFKTYSFNQTLDHFNYGPNSYDTFHQRYIVNSDHWAGGAAPIFAWLGAESPLDDDPLFVGLLTDIAPTFKALLVYIEHRFYGESIPLGKMEDAMRNETIRGCFNSAQALADYAQVLLHIKKQFNAATTSPIVVFGGSYGGMLAAWFRMKYPHVAVGALASSAPILYFDNITPQDGYYSIVTNDFKEVSQSCYESIRQSWAAIDTLASKPNGLSILSRKFKLCTDLESSEELKNYLQSMYAGAAQYNAPPKYPVTTVCGGIDGGGKDILDRIHGGVVAFKGNQSCYNIHPNSTQTDFGWSWQACSEIVIPIGVGDKKSMFPLDPFNMEEYSKECADYYGVPPRPHWITTYYGGHDIKTVLYKFGSNIIFSNGLRDPYSIGGVLNNISDTLLAVHTLNGSHCLDLQGARKTDPDWLSQQREREVKIIQSWIQKYTFDELNKDLKKMAWSTKDEAPIHTSISS